ncbi:ABC transporter ATP-binding protein [Candidatus Shapirobacteria bacterium]|nr:ABC transporter ATP-binding protein [Candidatus Shapirobacteria bacterium]
MAINNSLYRLSVGKRLLAYFKPFWPKLILVGLFILLGIAFSLLEPYFLGKIIDDKLLVGDWQGAKKMIFILGGIYVGGWLVFVLRERLMAKISQKALFSLRQDLFTHLQELSIRFFDQRAHGDLMSRLTNDIEAINRALGQNLLQLASNFLSLIAVLIFIFFINFPLALTVAISFPFVAGVTIFVTKRTRKGFQALQKEIGSLNGVLEEQIGGIRTVQAFSQQERSLTLFSEKNEGVCRQGIYASTFAFLLPPLINIFANADIGLVAGVGGWLALQGKVGIGLVVAFINYSRQVSQPVRQLADIYNSFQEALAGARRVFEVIDYQPEIGDAPNAREVNLRGNVFFDKVSFSYDKEPVLEKISFAIKPGQTLALVGPTGAGKTTIANLLFRFYEPREGKIFLDDWEIRKIKISSLRRQLGLVLQDPFLFSTTILENIRYGRPEAKKKEVVEAAKIAGAHQFIKRLPEGYETKLSWGGTDLSQGQRQLLTIARAVLANPVILLLDEATSSVDTRTEIEIQKALDRLRQGRTSIIIAHRLSTIRNADQILFIKKGRIRERGNHQELLAKKGFYYRFYRAQFGGLRP